jgi:glycosyltransferase involved in cell wall biosynthesis
MRHKDGKPHILVFSGHYLPGFKGGGPIRTLANLVDQLGQEFHFLIVTSDRDLGDRQPYSGIVADRWVQRGHADVFYCSPGHRGWRALLRTPQVKTPDLLYINSLFSSWSSIYPLIHYRLGHFGQAPVLLAPRGELSKGALSLKPIKKRAFLWASQLLGLHRGVTFQASSDHEADDIRRQFLVSQISLAIDMGGRSRDQRIAVARNLSGASTRALAPAIREPSLFKLAFLARIAPMKNLETALAILSRLSGLAIEFNIYGTFEDTDYWRRCEAAIAALPPNIRVAYRGPVQPEDVETVLSGYDAFLLPTLGENYGHVIREALSAGLPVLISDRTPWRGLEARGAGADLPLDDLDAFARRIRDWAALSPERFEDMRRAARALGDDPVTAAAALEANRQMFLDALRQKT